MNRTISFILLLLLIVSIYFVLLSKNPVKKDHPQHPASYYFDSMQVESLKRVDSLADE